MKINVLFISALLSVVSFNAFAECDPTKGKRDDGTDCDPTELEASCANIGYHSASCAQACGSGAIGTGFQECEAIRAATGFKAEEVIPNKIQPDMLEPDLIDPDKVDPPIYQQQ